MKPKSSKIYWDIGCTLYYRNESTNVSTSQGHGAYSTPHLRVHGCANVTYWHGARDRGIWAVNFWRYSWSIVKICWPNKGVWDLGLERVEIFGGSVDLESIMQLTLNIFEHLWTISNPYLIGLICCEKRNWTSQYVDVDGMFLSMSWFCSIACGSIRHWPGLQAAAVAVLQPSCWIWKKNICVLIFRCVRQPDAKDVCDVFKIVLSEFHEISSSLLYTHTHTLWIPERQLCTDPGF